MEQGAPARGAQVAFEANYEARFCDVLWGMTGTGVRTSTNTRFWRSEGRLRPACRPPTPQV